MPFHAHFTFPPNVNKNVQSQLLGRWLSQSPLLLSRELRRRSQTDDMQRCGNIANANGSSSRWSVWRGALIELHLPFAETSWRRTEETERRGLEGQMERCSRYLCGFFGLREPSSSSSSSSSSGFRVAVAVAALACLTSSPIAVDIVPEFQFDVHEAAAPVSHKSCSATTCLDRLSGCVLNWIGIGIAMASEACLSVLHPRG